VIANVEVDIVAQAVVAELQDNLGNVSIETVSPFCLIIHSYIVFAQGAITNFKSSNLTTSCASKFSLIMVFEPVTIDIS